jgi:hypothetical protein
LLFNDEQIRTIDLYSKLQKWSDSPDSKFKQLLDPGCFTKVNLNEELQTIYWDNGIDFCPNSLYEWGKEG